MLPNLARAFPDYRFIIATHSPFIVTSNPQAKVYGLLHTSVGRIHSSLIEEANLAASPEEVLREILDVPTTLPVWVENQINQVLTSFDSIKDDRARADAIYARLKELGLVATLKDYEAGTGGAK
jgi:predicted ATP-binding protein involved in virulence